MTEYIPTTEEVRSKFAWHSYDEGGEPGPEDYEAFDRWLAAYEEEVVWSYALRLRAEGYDYVTPGGIIAELGYRG